LNVGAENFLPLFWGGLKFALKEPKLNNLILNINLSREK
jgi:hypothetical protein